MTRDEVLALSDRREVWLRRLLAAEQDSYRAGHTDGHRLGYRAGRNDEAAERDAAWNAVARPIARGGPAHAELTARRYHVCCRDCRRTAHRAGCEQCEDRTAATFGLPHPDDYRSCDS